MRERSGADDIVFATVQLKNKEVIGSFTYGSAFGATEKSVFLKVYGKNGTVTVDLSDKKDPVVKVKLGVQLKITVTNKFLKSIMMKVSASTLNF